MRRILTASFNAALLVVAAAAGLLAYPEPLYAHHVEKGRLRLYSDKPFDEAIGRAVLAEVERRLALAPPELQDAVSVYRIFVSNDEWRRRLVFLWNDGAGGVNYYPIAGSVFLRQADINTDRLLRGNGQPVPPPRTLTYYAGHEIGHSLIGRRVGAYGNWRLPAWVREGLADYSGIRRRHSAETSMSTARRKRGAPARVRSTRRSRATMRCTGFWSHISCKSKDGPSSGCLPPR